MAAQNGGLNSVVPQTHMFFRTCVRTFRLLGAMTVFCALAFAVYVGTRGCPRWLHERIQNRLNQGTIVFRAERMRLDLLHGAELVLEDVRVFRKRKVGPPALEARQIALTPDLLALLRREVALRRVLITGGVLSPERLAPEQKAPPAIMRITRPVRTQVQLRNCWVYGLHIETLTTDLEMDALTVRCTGFTATVKNRDCLGSVVGDLVFYPARRRLRAHAATVGNPQFLWPLFEVNNLTALQTILRRFTFKETPPKTDLTFDIQWTNGCAVAVDGNFWLQDAAYRGVEFLRSDGGLHCHFSPYGSRVSIDPLLVVREEGNGRGGFTVIDDASRQQVEFTAVSSMDPLATFKMIGILITNGPPEWLRLRGPYRIFARGLVDCADMLGSEYEATAECGAFGNRHLLLENCTFKLAAHGPTNRCYDIRATFCGGEARGVFEFVIPHGETTNTPYRLEGSLSSVDFERLASELTKQPQKEYRGILSGRFSVTGLLEDATNVALRGNGSVRIKDGRVFMLPLFGGLSRTLARIIPGLDFVLRQTDAKADFVIADGRAYSDRILIEGDVLSLKGRGAYSFDGRLDFDVQVQLMKEQTLVAKILNTLTYPISKLFEFRLRGTLDSPDWYPVNFSSDLLKRLGLTAGRHEAAPTSVPVIPPQAPDAKDPAEAAP